MAGQIPKKIGPYRILEALGEGGMGAVFHARHMETGAAVALKTVRITKESLLNNLRREIHTLSRLHHPGIVKIVDQSSEDEDPWYAMDYVEGVTLRHYVLGANHVTKGSTGHSFRISSDQRAVPVLEGPAAVLSSAITKLLNDEKDNIDEELSSLVDQMDAFAPDIEPPTEILKSIKNAAASNATNEHQTSKGTGAEHRASSARWWAHIAEEQEKTENSEAGNAGNMLLTEIPMEPTQPRNLGETAQFPIDVSLVRVEDFIEVDLNKSAKEMNAPDDEDPEVPAPDDEDPDDAMTMLDVSPFHGLSLPSSGLGALKNDDEHSSVEDSGITDVVIDLDANDEIEVTMLASSHATDAVFEPDSSDDDEVTMLGVSPFAHAISSKELNKALIVVLRLCEPLAYLHGEGIVHCDLKPENVLVRKDGTPVLIDFGLLAVFAGWFNREVADFTVAGLGTLPYMSPEQISGRLIDARTDLYALGCILYELVVGEPPFVGNWTELIGYHLYTEPIPPAMRREGIPEPLNKLILKLLAKEPRDRIGHVDTVRSILEQLVYMEQDRVDVSGEEVAASRVYLFRPEIAGREKELAQMQEHVKAVKEGGSGLLLIGGESGVGKTRLMLELAQFARTRGLRVMTGECLDHPSPPFEAFQPFFLAVADRIRALGTEEREQLLGKKGELLLPYAPALQDFGEANETFGDGVSHAELPPSQLRMQTFRSLGHLLHQFAQEKPILLMLDDLHWADELTLGALVLLARMRTLKGVLIVGSFRSEEALVALHLLKANEMVSHIELERLGETAVASIMRDMLALAEIPPGFVKYLTLQSEGNPFFIAEYLHAAVEEGILWRNEEGQWEISEMYEASSLRDHSSASSLPSSLKLLVERRLRDISDKSATLLAVTSVLGREVPLHLLRQAMNLDMEVLWNMIDSLRRRQILDYRFDGTLFFVHDKIREIIYGGLSSQEQAVLHRRAAQAYEIVFRKERALYSTQIAYHWQFGEEPERALQYYKHGGFRAQQQQANDEAIRLYSTYLSLSTPPNQERIEVLHALSSVYEHVNASDLAREACEQALNLSRQLGLRSLEGKSLFLLGGIFWRNGSLGIGNGLYEEALCIQRELDERGPLGATLPNIAHYYFYQGQLSVSWTLYEEALGILRSLGQRRAIGRTLSRMGNIRIEQGFWKEARALHREALQIHQNLKDQLLEGIALHDLAYIHQFLGEQKSAKDLYTRALALFREIGNQASEGLALSHLATIYREQGALEHAEKSFQEALALFREVGNTSFEAQTLVQYIKLKRWMGEPVHTLEAGLNRAQQLMGDVNNPLHQVSFLCEFGHVQLASGKSAEQFVEQAQKLALQMGLLPQKKTPTSKIITRLHRAQQMHLKGDSLLYGELMSELPSALQPLSIPMFD